MRPIATGLIVFIVSMIVTRNEPVFQENHPIFMYAVSLGIAVFVVGIDMIIRKVKQKRKKDE